MVAPTDPTKTTIVTEALKVLGYSNPSLALITRYSDYHLERVKAEIWNRVIRGGDTRLKTLQTTAVSIGIENQRRYSPPTDFSEEYSFSLLDYTHSGIATAGGSPNVTLAADEDATVANTEGNYLLMYSGTSKGQFRQAVDYNTTTKVAVVDLDWDSGEQPVSGDGYLIINKQYLIDEQTQGDLDDLTTTVPARPDLFSKFDNEFYLNKPLDKIYGFRLRYYANLTQVDLTEGSDELITKIYRNWQHLFQQGLVWRGWNEKDDDRDTEAKGLFEMMLLNVLDKELPEGGSFEGFEI